MYLNIVVPLHTVILVKSYNWLSVVFCGMFETTVERAPSMLVV
jgi:hypothetical protein